MLKGKTQSGFEFEINEQALTDFRLLDLLSAIGDGDFAASVKAVTFLLGKKQKERLYDFCTVDGYVPADKVVEVFGEVMNACQELKK